MSRNGCNPIPTDSPSSIQYADPSPRTLNASEIAKRPPKSAIAIARVSSSPARRARRPTGASPFGPAIWSRRGSPATFACSWMSFSDVMSEPRTDATRRPRRRPMMATAFALGAAALAAPYPAEAASPLAGKRQFIDCQASQEQTSPKFNAWYWVHHYQDSNVQKAGLISKIAKVPTAKWFAGDSIRPLPTKLEDRFLARVDDPQVGGSNCDTPLGPGANDPYVGDFPVIAIRAMVHSGCRGYDGGGAWNNPGPGGLYKPWIDAFVKSLGRTWDGPGRFRY